MPASFLSAAVAALSLSSVVSADNVRRQMNYNTTSVRYPIAAGSGAGGAGMAAPTGFVNGSVPASPNTMGGGSPPNYEAAICPLYNDEVLLVNPTSQFLIQCGTTAQGSVIAVRKVKRQATTGAVWLVDCVRQCEVLAGCVATGFNVEQDTCTFYNNVEATYPDPNVDLAILVQPDDPVAASSTIPIESITGGPSTVAGGVSTVAAVVPMTTSTVYSTQLSTITACPASVTNCPARVVTSVISLYTTVCPVSGATETATKAAGACSACAYSTSVATVFSASTSGSSISLVPVSTQAVVVPILAAATPTTAAVSTQVGTVPSAGSPGQSMNTATITESVTVTSVVTVYASSCAAGAATGVPAPVAAPSVVAPGGAAPSPVAPAGSNPAAPAGANPAAPAGANPAAPADSNPAAPAGANPAAPAGAAPPAPVLVGPAPVAGNATGLTPIAGNASMSVSSMSNGTVAMPSMAVYTGSASKNSGMGLAAVVIGAAVLFL